MYIKPNNWFHSSHVNDRNSYILHVLQDQNMCFQYTYGNVVSVGSTDGIKRWILKNACMETKRKSYISKTIQIYNFLKCRIVMHLTYWLCIALFYFVGGDVILYAHGCVMCIVCTHYVYSILPQRHFICKDDAKYVKCVMVGWHLWYKLLSSTIHVVNDIWMHGSDET